MSANSPEVNRILSIVAPYAFPSLWVIACYLFSRVSGWSQLAIHYKATNYIPTGDLSRCWTPYSATLGRVRSKNVIKIGANQDGLFLKVFILFRLFHPNLFIPWRDVSCKRIENIVFGFKSEIVHLRFSKVPETFLKIDDSEIVEMLREMSRGNWKE